MTLDCLVSNPLRKQMFHQDYIDLRSLIKKSLNNNDLCRTYQYIYIPMDVAIHHLTGLSDGLHNN